MIFTMRTCLVIYLSFFLCLKYHASHPMSISSLARLLPNKPHNNHEDAVCEGLLTLRTGGLTKKRGVVWHYKGILRNPMNGAVIVGIEGLELTRRLSPLEMNHTSIHAKNVSVTPLSFLSRKVFVYTELQNRSVAVTKFRSGKCAPLRPLNPTKEIFERVTIGQFDATNGRRSRSTSTINDTMMDSTVGVIRPVTSIQPRTDFGRYIAEVELSGGRQLRTDKLSISRQPDGMTSSSLMNVMHRLLTGTVGQYGMQYNVVNFVRGRPRKLFNKWISLASPSDLITSGRSQEYYTVFSSGGRDQQGTGLDREGQTVRRIDNRPIGNDSVSAVEGNGLSKWWRKKNKNKTNQDLGQDQQNSIPLLTITPTTPSLTSRLSIGKGINRLRKHPQGDASIKYGEGPSWYSIGRPVASEIEAIRYNSLSDIPLYVRQLVKEQCPSFFTDADGTMLPIGDPFAVTKILTMENFARQENDMGKYAPFYKQILNKATAWIWKWRDRQ